LLPYHLRLAVRSLRRDPGFSAIVVVVLALGGGIFCTAVMTYLRMYWADPPLSPSLHQVEIPVPRESLTAAFEGTNAEPNVVAARERLSFPMVRVLAGSGLPVRQTATFRGRVLVRGAKGLPQPLHLAPVNARFAHADFFSMFPQVFKNGKPWTREQEASGAAVVILGKHLGEDLFGSRAGPGLKVMIDDRVFIIAGVLDTDQPFSPAWDRALTGGTQDQLYLPYAEHERLMARPEAPVVLAPEGPGYADLLASGTLGTTFWIDLPTPELRAEYARYLRATLGARGVRYVLRDLARIRRELAFPKSVMSFFLFLTSLALVGAGLVAMRLLLAKSLVRQGELSIFRAVGAPRGALVVRQLLEAALLSVAGGVAALAVAGPAAYVYNRIVADTDVPLAITGRALAVTVGATVLVGTLAAVYPAWRAASRRPTAALMRS
jgi:putative ABC transport system permease protein